MRQYSFLLSLFIIAIAAGCNDGTSSSGSTGTSCQTAQDCASGLCLNRICIERCTETSCSVSEYCADDGLCKIRECSDTTPCLNPDKICQNYACVDRPAECTLDAPCQNGMICVNGKCVDDTRECTDNKPCIGDMICSNGKCVNKPECSPETPCSDNRQECRDGKCVDKTECQKDADCGDGMVCSNGKCAPDTIECSDDLACQDPEKTCIDNHCVYECTAAIPCAYPQTCQNFHCVYECKDNSECKDGKICRANQCVDIPAQACTKGSCGAGKACAEDGQCFDAECSVIDTCPDGKFCQNNQCVTREELICYKDADCGTGYGCDNQKCVPENTCSLTRTCSNPDDVCHNGLCQKKTSPECSQTSPCPQEGTQCIAGKCIACSCADGETCQGDGTCVKTALSVSGKVTVGDACEYGKFKTHCDGNRIFRCSKDAEKDSYEVQVTDCGAKICANDPQSLDVSCYERCETEGEFIGECVGFDSDSVEFTKKCILSEDNKLIWAFSNGYKDCQIGCTNGRCNFVPSNFGKSCTSASVADSCQGDWLTYCYQENVITGTACSTISSAHFCALPSTSSLKQYPGLVGVCARTCAQAGTTHKECIKDSEGNVFSMNYICTTTTTGALAEFEAGYTQCGSAGCNVATGTCN